MTTTERLSDNCGYLQVARDWNLPYRVPLLIADWLDALHRDEPTLPQHREAWREANALIQNRNSFARFMATINALRERLQQIKRGEIAYEAPATYYETRP